MASTDTKDGSGAHWKRRFWLLLVAGSIFVFATSFATVRGWLIAPLRVHQPDAKGELAYVMADGPAIWERLKAAADLYHLNRVKEIYLLNEDQKGSFDFVRGENSTRVQQEIDYLVMLGVPTQNIDTIDVATDDWFSSRSEAVGLKRKIKTPESIVVVTSAPHTRRSRLCFERTFDHKTRVEVFSATEADESTETHSPIWIEYFKFAVYWVCV